MKKLWLILPIALLLCGCGAQETLETVTDVEDTPTAATAQQIVMELPEDVQMQVVQSEDAGKLYVCEDFVITVQTLPGGDLNRTVSTVTGYEKDQLQLLQTQIDAAKRIESVWASAGEGEEQVGRFCILDDGNYHYVVTAMTGASKSGGLQEIWNRFFDSVRLVSAEVSLNTGS